MDRHRVKDMTVEDLEAAKQLAPYFDAARAEARDPSVALLAAIIADAGRLQAERQPPPPTALHRLAARAGGAWRASAALAACALLGFWLGTAGGLSIEAGYLATSRDAVASAGDPVETFLELASME